MKTLQKLSVFPIICGLILMFASGNIEAGAKMVSLSFFGSIAVILLGFLLLAISTIILKKRAPQIIALPSTPSSKRRIEEYFIIFSTSKKTKKAQTPVKKKARTELPFSKADWEEVLAQAHKDLTPEQLKACEYSSPKKGESAKVLTPAEFAAL